MKKILGLVIVFCFLLSIPSYAQFRGGFGFIGGSPQGDFADFADFGAGGYLEAKYAFMEKIDAGLQVSFLGFAGADLTFTGGGSSVAVGLSATSIVPILITGDYIFTGGKTSPYAGLGIGPYLVDGGSATVSSGGSTIEIGVGSETKFGLAPRVGLQLGVLNLGVAYHIVSDFPFLGFHFGFQFGGRGF